LAPKQHLLSPHDVFLEELIDSVTNAALESGKAAPAGMPMCELEYLI